MRFLLPLLLATACAPSTRPRNPPDSSAAIPVGGTPSGLTGTGVDTGARTTSFDCAARPQPPFAQTVYPIATEEDFTFDTSGRLIYQHYDAFMGADQTGAAELLAPGAPEDPSGLDVINETELLVAGPNLGSMSLYNLDTGASDTLISGLSLPNAVLGARDGLVYVSEFYAGRVKWHDRANDISGSLATGLPLANGLALSPDEHTMYVAADAEVVAVQRDPGTHEWDPSTKWILHRAPSETFFTLDTDVCGWVYSVGFYSGELRRISPDGISVERLGLVSGEGLTGEALRWGGMNFGNGAGGWERDVLFITNRFTVVGVQVGIPGSPGPNLP